MNTPILSSQSSLELLVDSVTEIVHYSVQKTQYECAQIVREKLRELRVANFENAASEATQVTVFLNRLKMKLQCLKTEIDLYPKELHEVWQPLVVELENKIKSVRIVRSKINN